MKIKDRAKSFIAGSKARTQGGAAKVQKTATPKPDGKANNAQARSSEVRKPVQENKSESRAASTAGKTPVPQHSSLVSRISTFYTKMFASWLSTALIVIFGLVIAFNILYLVFDFKSVLDGVAQPETVQSFVDHVNHLQDAPVVLVDDKGETIASSMEQEILSTPGTGVVDFSVINRRVFLTHGRHYWVEGTQFTMVIYHDITFMLLEVVVIGAAAILLFLVSLLTIYVRGSYLTRKAFGVLDELIIKANNISSQNLNLRLNVSDSADEVIDFAVTFNRMMDRIERAYEKQNQFVSDASHELRTPIAVIQGYARMLERWGKDDKEILQESIEAINKESKNMQDLVDKLLFIARNDKDTLVLVKKQFDMSELIQELVRDTLMLETRHEIKSIIRPDVKVYGDRDRIKQTLRIFVDNAIKYTEPGGTITLKLDVEDNQAVAVVSDTGIGIPEKDLSNIFDRFYRVDTARERNKGGHGLGLSIARIIVLRHGGRIKVASKVGEGTRFSIFLPMEQPKENAEENQEA